MDAYLLFGLFFFTAFIAILVSGATWFNTKVHYELKIEELKRKYNIIDNE